MSSEFEPGSCPALNALLAAAEPCHQDRSRADEVFLKNHVAHVQDFRRNLEKLFNETKTTRPRTPLFRDVEPKVMKGFEDFRQGMKLVEGFLKGKSRTDLAQGCLQSRLALDEIFRLSAELGKEEESLRPDCDSPPIQQLVMLLDAVTRQQMDIGRFVKLVETHAQTIQQLRKDLAEWSRTKLESESLRLLLADLRRGAEQLAGVLADLTLACKTGAFSDLASHRGALLDAGQKLFDLHQTWMAALSPPVQCPRCGLANSAAARSCESCQGQLPQANPLPTSSFSADDEGGVGTPRLANIARVEQAVEAHQRGEIGLSELEETVAWMAARLESGRTQLRAAASGKDGKNEDVERMRRLIDAATDEVHRGIQLLLQYGVSTNPGLLDRGLEHLRKGEAAMLDAQAQMAPPRETAAVD